MSHSTLIGQDRSTGEIKDISQVNSGLECECVCPGCGDRLVAKKGQQVVHHFAHHSCAISRGCAETAVHLLGKKILSELTEISPPTFKPELPSAMSAKGFSFKPSLSFDVPRMRIIKSREEVRVGDFQPDVLVDTMIDDMHFRLALEVAVTHYVDEDKAKKIQRADMSMIEIELGHLVGKEMSLQEFKHAVEKQIDLSSWIWMEQKLRSHLGISVKNALHELSLRVDNEAQSAFDRCIDDIRRNQYLKLPEIDWGTVSENKELPPSTISLLKKTYGFADELKIVGTNLLDDGVEMVLSPDVSVPRLHVHLSGPCSLCEGRSYLEFEASEKRFKWGYNRRVMMHVDAFIDMRKELMTWAKYHLYNRSEKHIQEVSNLRSMAVKAVASMNERSNIEMRTILDANIGSVELDFRIWQPLVLEIVDNLKTRFTSAEVIEVFKRFAPLSVERQGKIAQIREYLEDCYVLEDSLGYESLESVIGKYLNELVERRAIYREKSTYTSNL